MECSKKYYGDETVNLRELIEANRKGFIKLEYYETKTVIQDQFIEYGIEVIKKEYINEQFIEEIQDVENITENEREIEEMISILKRNKVTPMGLEDTISDLVKEKIAD